MHRFKSPLLALIALLIVAGPLAGRVTQIDPTDPLQISTPTAWERSRQETIPMAEPVYQFSHSGISEDSGLRSQYFIGENPLLASPTELALVQRSTMTVLWNVQPEFEIMWIDTFTGDDSPLNPRIAIHGETTCALLDASNGDLIWENTDCPYGGMSPHDKGAFLHTSTVDDQHTMRLLDEETGEERWTYTYQLNQDIGSMVRYSNDQQVMLIATVDSIDAVAIDTGEVVWTAPIAIERGLIQLESYLLVLRNEEIIALDKATGAEIWFSYMEPDYSTRQSWVQPHTEEKLLISVGDSISILETATGLEIDRYLDAEVAITEVQDSAVRDVFTLRIGNDSVSVDWVTLKEIWRVNGGGSPQLHHLSNSQVLILTTGNGRTLLIDPQTGEQLKNSETTALSSAGDGDIILLPSETHVDAYDTVAQRSLWRFTPPDGVGLWNTTSDHVIISNQRFVYVIDVNTGEVISETPHPDGSQRYILNSRFVFHWDGSTVTGTHHLTKTKQTFHGIYVLEQLTLSGSGNVLEARYGSTMTLLDRESGKRLFSGDLPIDYRSDAGEYVMLMGDDTNQHVQFVEATGGIRWSIDVPSEFVRIQYLTAENKVLLQARTRALLIDAQTGEIIMELPIAYDADGDNDSLYFSEVDAVLVRSDYASAIYQVPAPSVAQFIDETIVRGAPSATGVERAIFPAGTPVMPTGNVQERSDGVWIEVTVKDITGWVHEDDLSGWSPSPEATPAA